MFDKLPRELLQGIYDFVDYDTKTSVLLHSNKYIMDCRQLRYIFTIQKMKNIYENSVNKNLFEDTLSRTSILKSNIDALFPAEITYEYVDRNGVQQQKSIAHPLKEVILSFKSKKNLLPQLKGKLLINSINEFRSMKSNILDLDRHFCKIAYLIVRNIIYYRKVLMKKNRYIEVQKELSRIKKMNQQKERKLEQQRKQLIEQRRIHFEKSRSNLIKAFVKLSKRKHIETYITFKIQPNK